MIFDSLKKIIFLSLSIKKQTMKKKSKKKKADHVEFDCFI